MMKNKINFIATYFNELFPNATSELKYHKDYELLISIVLSAQATDKMVNKITSQLFNKYPNLESLKTADINDLINILKPLGLAKKKAYYLKEIATTLVDKYDGKIPNNRKALESLKGVGRKTANLVLAILYNQPLMAVDTHVSRVSKRLRLVDKSDTPLKIEHKLSKLIAKDKLLLLHYQIVLFGRYYCKAINPICDKCKLKDICFYL